MEQILPSIHFGTFKPEVISNEPVRSSSRKLLDLHTKTLTPGLSYVLDQQDFIERVGYIPPFDSTKPPQLWALPPTTQSYASLTGSYTKASILSLNMNIILSSSARQFYADRPELLVPSFISSPLTDFNIPPSGIFDTYSYNEFPLCYLQPGGWNLGDKVLYFQSGPSSKDLRANPDLSLIPVWNTVTEAEKTLPASKYKITPTPILDVPSQFPVSTILTLIANLTVTPSLRLKVITLLRDKDLTNPQTLTDLLKQL